MIDCILANNVPCAQDVIGIWQRFVRRRSNRRIAIGDKKAWVFQIEHSFPLDEQSAKGACILVTNQGFPDRLGKPKFVVDDK